MLPFAPSDGYSAAPGTDSAAIDVLVIARQVLHEEAAALHDVAAALAATPDFVQCVRAILALKGRVVGTTLCGGNVDSGVFARVLSGS